MTPEATLARFREYMVGPTRFMTLLSCFELGIVDTLRDRPGLTAAQLGEAVGVKPDAVEQLLFLLVKEHFVAYDEDSGGYTLDALADDPVGDLTRALTYMNMIKVVALRQMFYLTESARTGTRVPLNTQAPPTLPGERAAAYDRAKGCILIHRRILEPILRAEGSGWVLAVLLLE
jgi:hypothetical protein